MKLMRKICVIICAVLAAMFFLPVYQEADISLWNLAFGVEEMGFSLTDPLYFPLAVLIIPLVIGYFCMRDFTREKAVINAILSGVSLLVGLGSVILVNSQAFYGEASITFWAVLEALLQAAMLVFFSLVANNKVSLDEESAKNILNTAAAEGKRITRGAVERFDHVFTQESPEKPAAGGALICRTCGSPMGAEDLFCMACGAKRAVLRSCPVCGRELGEDDAFCARCGTKWTEPEKRVCRNCGRRLKEDEAFCPSCGTKYEM